MFVKAKQSGELLSTRKDEDWTARGVDRSVANIQRAFEMREEIDLEGLLVVSGAGNIMRGKEIAEKGIARGKEDLIGRIGTMANTIMIYAGLLERNVPTQLFIADNMGFKDPALGTVEPYTVEAEREAYERERVVLIAGGTGEDGKTTDNAVMEYGRRHITAWPEDTVVVLKGTKHGGIFTADPEHFTDIQLYAQIAASDVLADYDRLGAVDRGCLDLVQATGLCMRVYKNNAFSLDEVIVGNHNSDIGTLIVPGPAEPVLAGV